MTTPQRIINKCMSKNRGTYKVIRYNKDSTEEDMARGLSLNEANKYVQTEKTRKGGDFRGGVEVDFGDYKHSKDVNKKKKGFWGN